MIESEPKIDAPMARVDAYLVSLTDDTDRIAAVRRQVAEQTPQDIPQAMQSLCDALAARVTPGQDSDEAALIGRIEAAYPELAKLRQGERPSGALRGASMPGMARRGMLPAGVDRRPWRIIARLLPGLDRRLRVPKAVPSRLRGVVRLRQLFLFFLVALPAAGATFYMLTVLPHQGGTPLEIVILALAALLFAWILVGFWTAMAGFFVLWRGDKYCVSATPQRQAHTDGDAEPDLSPARTAIVMPIYEEDVTRTFAGLQAMIESLSATGRLDEFDVFVLSDSVKPDTIAAEQQTWAATCQALGVFGRLHYRRRRARVKRKSGNLADFCRRWGGHYRYMIVLDADSIMIGSTLTAMVDRMQANPSVGLIQTPPTAVNRVSVLARVQQFATRVYGRMFAAGLHYWHLDNAHYWGHNAIIRIAPFMDHCALPRLPGRGALSGEILSHDFVEAALMRRAGWGVYIAYDLPGSYEEVPPSLIDELGRDRRWCQGNIQHLRLLFSDNLAPAHRALFANGVMAYTSAAIWFVFLVLSSFEAVMEAISTPDYFPSPGALFPSWPVWQPIWALTLFYATLVVLFLPKIVGMGMIIARGEHKLFGGVGNIIGSTLIEILLTSLLAPIRMLAHTVFVATTLIGKQVKWNNQQREDATVPWWAATRFHLPGMILALVWGSVLYIYTPGFFPWLLPILVPLFVAPVITVLTSSVNLGRAMSRQSLQQIPEEVAPPDEIARVAALNEAAGPEANLTDLLVDPRLNALHVALLGPRRRLNTELDAYRQELGERVLAEGPDALTTREQVSLLADPRRMQALHGAIWRMLEWPAWVRASDRPASAPV